MQAEKLSKKFLREVETRIPKDNIKDQSSNKKCTVSTQTLAGNCGEDFNISPSVSSCWISDNASMDPYASSMAFSVTEDDATDAGDEVDLSLIHI